MKAKLKELFSPDSDDLSQYIPDDPRNFSLFIQAMIGPEDQMFAESFNIVVCTPQWLENEPNKPLIGRHFLIVDGYSYQEVRSYVATYASNCAAQTWQELAEMLGRLGKWEFEDYQTFIG